MLLRRFLIRLDAKKCCFRSCCQFYSFQAGRNQTKLARKQFNCGVAAIGGDCNRPIYNRDDPHLLFSHQNIFRSCNDRFVNLEDRALHEMAKSEIWTTGKLCFNDRRLEVIEINAGERLGDVQLARLALQPDAIPIEHPVSGVRVLLDFKNYQLQDSYRRWQRLGRTARFPNNLFLPSGVTACRRKAARCPIAKKLYRRCQVSACGLIEACCW